MSEVVSNVEVRLSNYEKEILSAFRCRCVVEGVKEFSSDNFRGWGFDKALYGTTQHNVGLFFFKLVKLGIARKVGYKPSTIESNHLREIKVYSWVES